MGAITKGKKLKKTIEHERVRERDRQTDRQTVREKGERDNGGDRGKVNKS